MQAPQAGKLESSPSAQIFDGSAPLATPGHELFITQRYKLSITKPAPDSLGTNANPALGLGANPYPSHSIALTSHGVQSPSLSPHVPASHVHCLRFPKTMFLFKTKQNKNNRTTLLSKQKQNINGRKKTCLPFLETVCLAT
jgi:hypothetical protein